MFFAGLYNDNLFHQMNFDVSLAETITSFLKRLAPPICLIAHNGRKFDFPLLKTELQRLGVHLPPHLLCADSLEAFIQIDEEIDKPTLYDQLENEIIKTEKHPITDVKCTEVERNALKKVAEVESSALKQGAEVESCALKQGAEVESSAMKEGAEGESSALKTGRKSQVKRSLVPPDIKINSPQHETETIKVTVENKIQNESTRMDLERDNKKVKNMNDVQNEAGCYDNLPSNHIRDQTGDPQIQNDVTPEMQSVKEAQKKISSAKLSHKESKMVQKTAVLRAKHVRRQLLFTANVTSKTGAISPLSDLESVAMTCSATATALNTDSTSHRSSQETADASLEEKAGLTWKDNVEYWGQGDASVGLIEKIDSDNEDDWFDDGMEDDHLIKVMKNFEENMFNDQQNQTLKFTSNKTNVSGTWGKETMSVIGKITDKSEEKPGEQNESVMFTPVKRSLVETPVKVAGVKQSKSPKCQTKYVIDSAIAGPSGGSPISSSGWSPISSSGWSPAFNSSVYKRAARDNLPFKRHRLSYKLPDVHKRVVGCLPLNLHTAEDDCLSLVRIFHQMAAHICPWIDNNAVPFDSLPLMYDPGTSTCLQPDVFPFQL